jgi:glycosyltransferase involved in cell wall biosynthesis
MNVVILHPTLPAYRKDFFEKLDTQLKEKNIDLTVIHGTSFFNKSIKPDTDPKYSAIPMPTKELKFLGYRIVWWKGIFKTLRKIDPDIVIILFSPGNLTFWLVQLFCYIKKIKIGIWSNGSVRQEIKGFKKKFRGFFLNFFVRRADFHICYGSRYKNELLSFGIPEPKIFIAQNTINIDSILLAYPERKYDLSRKEFILLSVGALIPEKNLDLAICAVARLIKEGNNVIYNIVGQGKIIEDLKSLVQEENMTDNIFLLGYKSKEEIPSWFLNADAFILTGMGGLAINEAMAYGMPIISSMADGTIADLVYDGLNGYLIDDKDLTIEFIYKTCKRAVQIERSRLMEMGVESRKIVSSKATLSNMVNGYEKAILYGMSQL